MAAGSMEEMAGTIVNTFYPRFARSSISAVLKLVGEGKQEIAFHITSSG